MTITRYQPGPRMSQAVAGGGLLFTAGQVAQGADVTAQTRAILAQMDALLAVAGTDKSRLVSASMRPQPSMANQ
jgi:enamine deaminase RidA (YjgF/YER057c/UK114 family)